MLMYKGLYMSINSVCSLDSKFRPIVIFPTVLSRTTYQEIKQSSFV
jgi:hypothetical protein